MNMIEKAISRKDRKAQKIKEMKHIIQVRDLQEKQSLTKNKIEVSQKMIKFGNETERSKVFLKDSIKRLTKELEEITSQLLALE